MAAMGWCRRVLRALLPAALALTPVLVSGSRPAAAAPPPWVSGDVFVSVSNGSYEKYSNGGTLQETLSDGKGGTTTGCAFDPEEANLYTTNFSDNQVEVYSTATHALVNTFTTSPSANEDVVFARDGTFYVSHPGPSFGIDHYSAGNTLIAHLAAGVRTDWLDLAIDQSTMFYTDEGQVVHRWNVASNVALPDFAALPPGSPANGFALRLLAPGDGSGGLLVADNNNIYRLNGAGATVQTYNLPSAQDGWFGLNLDPDGTSFWSGSFIHSNFARFNIATGALELGPISTGTGESTVFGICLKGEPTAALEQINLTPTTATNNAGTSHTVTANVDSDGAGVSAVPVFFSVVSGPNAGASGTCSVDTTCQTDPSGNVSFTYTSNGTAGTDTIQACFVDGGFIQHCATATKTWIAVADLSITKSGAPDPALVGGTLTYTLSVTNHGPSTATGVTVNDPLPAGVSLVSATPSQGSCSGTVTCALGTLTNGASATVTIVVHPTAKGTITNTASVSANEPDPNPANNSATATTRALIVSGSAFGLEVRALLVNVGPLPTVSQSGPGTSSQTLASISVPAVLTANALTVSSSVGPDTSVTSSATVAQLSILAGTISATTIQSTCTANASGVSGSTTIAQLVIAGQVFTNISPAPNTTINVLGVGSVVLNEQIQPQAGSITVNALHVHLLTGIDIIVAQAACVVDP
jgi:uncharacterized repeat protein (TIGR01451 family)